MTNTPNRAARRAANVTAPDAAKPTYEMLEGEVEYLKGQLTNRGVEVDMKDAQIQELIGKVNTLANEVVFFRNIASKLSGTTT